MKFVTGAETLSTLVKQTSASTDDLGALVRQLANAAEPIRNDFQGAGRVAFDAFKANTDEIAVGLNRALASVLQGQAGQDRAIGEGVQRMADETRATMASAQFDAARFGGGGSAAV